MNLQEIRNRTVVSDSGFWEWSGRLSSEGYGVVSFKGRDIYVHRMAYESAIEPIAPKMTIDHLCRNRRCVNPEHLEMVSIAVNVMRGQGSTAIAARRNGCAKGHPYTPENLYVRKDTGHRQCRECTRQSHRARRERNEQGRAS